MSNKTIGITLGAVVAAAALYTGANVYYGNQYENSSKEDLTRIKELIKTSYAITDDIFTIEQTEFNKGIFSSKAKYLATLSGTPISILENVSHGPFVGFHVVKYQSTATIERTDITDRLFKLTEGKEPFKAVARESLLGDFTTTLTMPPITYKDENTNVNFSGLEMTVKGDRKMSFYKGDMHMSSFTFVEKQGSAVNIDGANLKFNFKKDKKHTDLFVGDMLAKFKGIHVKDNASNTFAFEDFNINSNQIKGDNDAISSKSEYTLKKLLINEKDFGAQALGITLEQIDTDAYLAIQTAVEQKKSYDQMLSIVYEKLLPKKPKITIEPIEWTMPKGKSSASFSVTFTQPSSPQLILSPELVDNIQFKMNLSEDMLIEVISRSGELSGISYEEAEAMAKEAWAKGSAQLKAQNLIQQDGKQYTSEIQFQNNIFTVNGRSMSIEEFINLPNTINAEPTETEAQPVE